MKLNCQKIKTVLLPLPKFKTFAKRIELKIKIFYTQKFKYYFASALEYRYIPPNFNNNQAIGCKNAIIKNHIP